MPPGSAVRTAPLHTRWGLQSEALDILRAWFTRLRSRGHNTHYIPVLGTGRLARDFPGSVEGRPGLGIAIMAVCPEPDALGNLDPVARQAAHDGKVVQVPLDPVGLPLANAREEASHSRGEIEGVRRSWSANPTMSADE
jgi:hypothetical protein